MDSSHEHQEYDQHPFLQKVIQHKNAIILGCLAAVVLIFIAVSFLTGAGHKARGQYLQFNEAFSNLKEFPSEETLNKALQSFQALPQHSQAELAQLTQLAIALKNTAIIENFSKNSAHTQPLNLLPYYQEYTEVSLLMTKEDWENASKRSLDLHEKMRNNNSTSKPVFGLVLYAYNLIRIAFLQQKLQNPQVELAAWEDLEELLYNQEKVIQTKYSLIQDRSLLQAAFASTFSLKSFHLKDYIKKRKSVLTQKS